MNPRIWETEQMDLCEFKAILGYTKSIQSKRETAHTKVILALRITCLYSQH